MSDDANKEQQKALQGEEIEQIPDEQLDKATGGVAGTLIGKAIGDIASNRNDDALHVRRSESTADEIAPKS